MSGKVAIVGYAQSRHQHDMQKTREDMVFDVAVEALRNAGILRKDLGTVITSSTDFLDGRTISNVFLSMAVGAYLKDESKVEEDGTGALQYAMMRIQAGGHDVALVEAHTQGSTFNPHQVSVYMVDPLFDRQVGLLNDMSAAALSARKYMDAYDVVDEHLAMVAAKNLGNAAHNANAHRRMPDITTEEVLESKMLYDPIRELMMSPVSDGCAILVLASEKKAHEICANPVWITGLGMCHDGYLRDRDPIGMESMKKAAAMAYEQAGITDPFRQIDCAEITERYAHEELMAYEALGLCRPGKGKIFIEEGTTDIYGEMPVNPSGGALAADPICATGLIRVIEAARQIRGECNSYQSPEVKRALAHGQFGICAQKNTVVILEGEA